MRSFFALSTPTTLTWFKTANGPIDRYLPKECEKIMLVLSRKKNESIVINDDIKIVVVEIRGDKVRLGVEAPKELSLIHI